LTTQQKKDHDWPKLVSEYRVSLELTLEKFGLRYGVTKQSVSYWEKGVNAIPNQVTWDILQWLEDAKEAK